MRVLSGKRSNAKMSVLVSVSFVSKCLCVLHRGGFPSLFKPRSRTLALAKVSPYGDSIEAVALSLALTFY